MSVGDKGVIVGDEGVESVMRGVGDRWDRGSVFQPSTPFHLPPPNLTGRVQCNAVTRSAF